MAVSHRHQILRQALTLRGIDEMQKNIGIPFGSAVKGSIAVGPRLVTLKSTARRIRENWKVTGTYNDLMQRGDRLMRDDPFGAGKLYRHAARIARENGLDNGKTLTRLGMGDGMRLDAMAAFNRSRSVLEEGLAIWFIHRSD